MGARKPFSFEERQKIEEGIKNNLSHRQIAEQLNRSHKVIYIEIKTKKGSRGYVAQEAQDQANLKNENKYTSLRKAFSELEIQYITQRYQSGHSIDVIAKEVGSSFKLVRKKIKELSIEKNYQHTIGIVERVMALEEQISIIFDLLKELSNDKVN